MAPVSVMEDSWAFLIVAGFSPSDSRGADIFWRRDIDGFQTWVTTKYPGINSVMRIKRARRVLSGPPFLGAGMAYPLVAGNRKSP